MGHFELNSGSRNSIRNIKPRKRVHTVEIRLLRKKSFRNHEINVALISDVKIRKDRVYYLGKVQKMGLLYLLPLACLVCVLTATLFAARHTLALI